MSAKRHWLAALLAMSVSSVLHAQQPGQQTFDFESRPRTLATFVPNSSSSPQGLPLLVLLHGSMGNGAAMIAMWREEAERSGIVLVAPDALDQRAWQLQSDGPKFIRAALGVMQMRNAIDASRVYLFGYSGGAVYALTLSMIESQLFAATAVYAGAWRESDEYRAVALAVRKIPLAIHIGDRDVYFPLSAAKRTQRALRGSGHSIDLHVLHGRDHDYAAVAPTVNRQIVEFFLRHRLETSVGTAPDPRG